MRLSASELYHGITKGPIKGSPKVPFFVAHDKSLAESYGASSGKVVKVLNTATNPLVLDTPEKAIRAWHESGIGPSQERFHPNLTGRFCAWAKALGHDAVVIPQSAFEGELGYKQVAGRWGEPQTIFLDPSAFRLVENDHVVAWLKSSCKFASNIPTDPTSMTKEEWVRLNLPGMSFDEILNDQPSYRRYLDLKKEWERAMERSISTGRIGPDEATKKKFYFNPRHGPLPTEPLYHVTTAKDAVISQGLKSRDELKQSSGKGLGGGESNTISFTKDLGIAKGIYENLKEAKAFAEGRTTVMDLIEMARSGAGAKRPWIDDWMGYLSHGGSQDYKWNGQIPSGVKELLAGYETYSTGFPQTREEMEKEGWEPIPEYKWTHGTSDAYTVFRRKLSPEKRAEELFQLFKSWSSIRESAGGPLDPLYFNSDPVALAKIPEDQIAILEFKAKPKSYGHQVSSLGEWRTYSGEAVDFVREVPVTRTAATRSWLRTF